VAPLAGFVLAAAALLVISGISKLARPEPAAKALAAAGWPSSPSLSRSLGGAEVAFGAWVLAMGGPAPTAVLALVYLAFAGFSAHLMRVAPGGTDCGCFGTTGTNVSRTHIVTNTVVAVAISSTLIHPVGGVADVIANSPGSGIPLLALSTLLAGSVARLLAGRLPGTSLGSR
jgi:uncharacterized membrane protein YphA (DoxX/SURF4 family)